MKGNLTSSEKFDALRRKAEQKLENTLDKEGTPLNGEDVGSIKQLMHELQVHQTELEMQNEELQKAQEELRKSEQRYAELFDSAPISYFTLSDSGEILDLNLTAAEKFGMDKDYLVNKSLYEFIDKPSRDRLYLHLVEVFKTDTHQQCELPITIQPSDPYVPKPSHEKTITFWALLESKVFQESGGKKLCRTVISDITDRKNMESELNEAKEKAEENDSLKSAFLANMSHEIRTPMNGILGFAELLKKPELSESEKSQYIEVINKSGHRLINTLNDIVEISKIEAGVSIVDKQEVNINRKIEDLVQFFQPEANNKEITLTLDALLPENHSTIFTDESKIESILTNLIKNALKYTDKGEIHIGCSLKGGTVRFYVEDTGIGIPQKRQDAIFNRFEQADIGDKRAFEGSGLGLALTKSYVSMLNGSIGLESVEGKGSTFLVNLPFEQPLSENSKESKSGAVKDGPCLEDHHLKILVAEDDEASFLVLAIILKKIPCEVIHAYTGKQALDLAYKNPDLDVILMDIKMPEMDGYEATRQIREFNSKVNIIAQTAYALKGDQAKSLNAGINDYITKPVQEKALMEALKAAIAK